jgi:hypothetical protein
MMGTNYLGGQNGLIRIVVFKNYRSRIYSIPGSDTDNTHHREESNMHRLK